MPSTTSQLLDQDRLQISLNNLFSFRYSVFILFVSLVVFRIVGAVVPFGLFGLLDEIFVVLFFFYFSFLSLYTLKLKKTYLFVLLMMLFICTLSYFSTYYAGATKTIIQSMIYMKFIIIFLLFYYGLNDKLFHKFIKFLFYFTVIGFMTNLILGSIFFDLVNARILERNGIYRYIGFQYSGNVLAIASSVLIFYSLYNNDKKKNIIWNILFIIIIFFTGSHTGLLFLFLLYFIYMIDKKGLSPTMILSLLILPFALIAMIFIAGIDEKLVETSDRFESGNESGYARTVVLFNAVLIASDNFPLGSGAASYATPLSRDSEIYYDYGMDKVNVIKWFINGNDRNSGIYDTSFGMLIGELGFIGTLLFLIFHFFVFKKLYKNEKKKIITLFSIFCALIFVAITKPVFIQWDFGLYLAILFLIPLRTKRKLNAI